MAEILDYGSILTSYVSVPPPVVRRLHKDSLLGGEEVTSGRLCT